MKNILCIIVTLCLLAISSAGCSKAREFKVAEGCFTIDSDTLVIKAAELHYPRIPKEYWRHRIQMCKAMGMNTICMYIFWNFHEQQEGVFDFEGQKDIREFAKTVASEDMFLIVRPGPYVCAEWDMGGLPWWLLNKEDIRLRTQDPYFMERLGIFERKVAEQMADLTVDKGGPIIMLQVENEMGSYSEDKPYVAAVRDSLRACGWDKVQLFQCDWASNFEKNALPDLLWTMNFGCGADIEKQFSRLGEIRPEAPQMCSEYWSGWFDKWGARHETRPTDKLVNNMEEMLKRNISFSLYMAHGGTNFAQWAGANSPGYNPDVTSYDYDAPLTEQGKTTEKYLALRELLTKYSANKLPEVPENIPTMSLDTISNFKVQYLNVDYNADVVMEPSNIEKMQCGWGMAAYRHIVSSVEAEAQYINTKAVRDYGRFFVNGEYIGTLWRGGNDSLLWVDNRLKAGDTLEVIIDCMGRINFGKGINDRKGLYGSVNFLYKDGNSTVAYNWQQVAIPLGEKNMPVAGKNNMGVKIYTADFLVQNCNDTYIDLSNWGKGMVWVNGFNLGRYWQVGPQQTLYLPGCYLHKGANQIVILDMVPTKVNEITPKIWGVDQPEYNKLQRWAWHKRITGEVKYNDATQIDVPTGKTEVDVKRTRTQHICLNFNMDQPTKVYEIEVIAANGKLIRGDKWKVVGATQEDKQSGNYGADKLIDIQDETPWKPVTGGLQRVLIDLGERIDVQTVRIKW